MYIVCKPFARSKVRPKASSGHDMLIAGTAIEHQLVLATGNVRDFMGCGVQVVNPFDGV
jgi:toxin FitB